MTSSKYTSFMERAGITDAFSHNRRLGAAFVANDKKADSWVVPGRHLQRRNEQHRLQPHRLGRGASAASTRRCSATTRLHLGANFEHRENKREAQSQQLSGAADDPADRSALHRAPARISAKGDDIVGLEVRGDHEELPLRRRSAKGLGERHLHRGRASGHLADPTQRPRRTGRSQRQSELLGRICRSLVITSPAKPAAYKGGSFGRVKVLHPFNDGGWGAFQINGRVDYLNLNDRRRQQLAPSLVSAVLRQRRQAARLPGAA